MTKNEYNGWFNHETWCVNLWLDNEQRSQEYWHNQAKRALATAKVTPSANANFTGREIFTVAERATFTLAAVLKSEIEEWNPLEEDANMWTDLLNAALSEVNWHEIAKAMIDALEPDKDQIGAQGMEDELGING